MTHSAGSFLALLPVSALLYASPLFARPQTQQQDFAAASKVLFQRRDWKALEDLARTDLLAHPKDANGWEILGVSLGCQNRLPEAQAAFERAYSIEPAKVSNCANLAVIYAKTSKRTELEKLMKELQARTREDVALRVLDREEVFQALAPNGTTPITQSRSAAGIYPEPKNYPAGPVRELTFGRYPHDPMVNEGLALFEVYVAPNGSIQSVQFLAGTLKLPRRAEPLVKLIQFSALAPSEGVAVQRTKIVLRIAGREGRRAEGESGLVTRVGLGASLAEAERNTVDVKW